MPNEVCAIRVAGVGGPLRPCPVFDTEGSADPLTLPDGSARFGAECLAGTVLTGEQTLAWHSDHSVQGTSSSQGGGDGLPMSDTGAGGGGWQICF